MLILLSVLVAGAEEPSAPAARSNLIISGAGLAVGGGVAVGAALAMRSEPTLAESDEQFSLQPVENLNRGARGALLATGSVLIVAGAVTTAVGMTRPKVVPSVWTDGVTTGAGVSGRW